MRTSIGAFLPGVRGGVFDAVGTLIHPNPPAAVVYAEVGRRFGSQLAAAEIGPRFIQALAREDEEDRTQGWRTSEERERRRWRHIVAEVLDDTVDAQRCFRELFDHFGEPGSWRCEADAGAVVAQLTDAGYVLGLASNYDRRLRAVARGLPALMAIPHLVISSEVGWRKPAPEFFYALGQRLGLPGKELLYVGDDPVNDYDGATAAGLQAVLFDPQQKHAGGPRRTIERLLQLLDL